MAEADLIADHRVHDVWHNWRRNFARRWRETAGAHEMVIHPGSINRDHVHMLETIPKSMSASQAVQYLKGASSHKLLSEFGALRKQAKRQ